MVTEMFETGGSEMQTASVFAEEAGYDERLLPDPAPDRPSGQSWRQLMEEIAVLTRIHEGLTLEEQTEDVLRQRRMVIDEIEELSLLLDAD